MQELWPGSRMVDIIIELVARERKRIVRSEKEIEYEEMGVK